MRAPSSAALLDPSRFGSPVTVLWAVLITAAVLLVTAAVTYQDTPLVLPAVKKKKDLAKELGVSRTTLWRMTKRQEAAGRSGQDDPK